MRNHYIPKHYLLGFTEEHPPELWVYSRHKSNNPSKRYIKSVGAEDNFYSDAVEEFLGKNIENDAAPILRRVIDSHQTLTENEKAIISKYIITFLARTPCGKERIRKVIAQQLDRLTNPEKMKRFLIEKIGRELTEEETKQCIAFLQTKRAEQEENREWEKLVVREAVKLTNGILPMSWHFFIAEEDISFVTSNCPVFFFEELGIGNTLSELTFPISKRIALWITPTQSTSQIYLKVTKEIVAEVNSRTASSATEVFTATKRVEIEELVKQTYQPRRLVISNDLKVSGQPFQ